MLKPVTAAVAGVYDAAGQPPSSTRILFRTAGIIPEHSVAIAVLALALVGVIGINCALVAGFLSWQGGANPANAILKGGAAFGAALVIGIALLVALNVL